MTSTNNRLDEASFEILKMARDLVINEYIDKRAEMHNRWLVESDVLWNASKLALPYPSIPPYPTEMDILDRARVLIDFVTIVNEKNHQEEIKPAVVQPVVLQSVEMPEQEQQETASATLPTIAEKPIEEPRELPEHLFSQEENVEYALPRPNTTTETTGGRVIPAMFKKLEDIRSTWSSR